MKLYFKKLTFIAFSILISFCAVLIFLELLFRGLSYYQEQKDLPISPRVENSRGLNDYEYKYQKPGGVYRILLLGDSFVDGITPFKDNFVKKLENLLNKNSRFVKFQVINGGRRGADLIYAMGFLLNEGYKYNPDMVILSFFHNDVYTNNKRLFKFLEGNNRYMEFLKRIKGFKWAMDHSSVYREIAGRLDTLGESLGYKRSYAMAELEEAKTSNGMMYTYLLKIFHEYGLDNGIQTLALTLPDTQGIEQNPYPFGAIDKIIIDYCKSNGINSINLLPAFTGQKTNHLRWSSKDHHPNAYGNELLAKQLFLHLKNICLAGSVKLIKNFLLSDIIQMDSNKPPHVKYSPLGAPVFPSHMDNSNGIEFKREKDGKSLMTRLIDYDEDGIVDASIRKIAFPGNKTAHFVYTEFKKGKPHTRLERRLKKTGYIEIINLKYSPEKGSWEPISSSEYTYLLANARDYDFPNLVPGKPNGPPLMELSVKKKGESIFEILSFPGKNIPISIINRERDVNNGRVVQYKILFDNNTDGVYDGIFVNKRNELDGEIRGKLTSETLSFFEKFPYAELQALGVWVPRFIYRIGEKEISLDPYQFGAIVAAVTKHDKSHLSMMADYYQNQGFPELAESYRYTRRLYEKSYRYLHANPGN